MNNKKLDTEITKLLSNTFFIASDKINQNTSMQDIDNWDSLKHMTLVISLEEHFKIKFNGEEIITIDNFKAIKKLIQKKINLKNETS